MSAKIAVLSMLLIVEEDSMFNLSCSAQYHTNSSTFVLCVWYHYHTWNMKWSSQPSHASGRSGACQIGGMSEPPESIGQPWVSCESSMRPFEMTKCDIKIKNRINWLYDPGVNWLYSGTHTILWIHLLQVSIALSMSIFETLNKRMTQPNVIDVSFV